MSIVAASFFGCLIISLANVTVNGSLIHLFCQYPNSEVCKTFHRLNNLNRYNAELSELNSRYSNVEDEQSFGEDAQVLRNQLGAFRHSPRTTEELLRCINLGDDSCNNGSLPGSGKDDGYLNGSGNPGKRSLSSDISDEEHLEKFGRLGNLIGHTQ